MMLFSAKTGATATENESVTSLSVRWNSAASDKTSLRFGVELKILQTLLAQI